MIPAPTQSITRARPRASRIGSSAWRIPAEDAPDGGLRGARDGHQYRILGSTNALTKSITRLTSTTTSAKTTMIPCTAT